MNDAFCVTGVKAVLNVHFLPLKDLKGFEACCKYKPALPIKANFTKINLLQQLILLTVHETFNLEDFNPQLGGFQLPA